MATIRFATVRDLYEAFPIAQDDVGAQASDQPSLDFVRARMEEAAWEPAITYCAYLLPRREAVWWGCQSLRDLQPHRAPQDTMALDVAEAWVREPEEDRRRAALNLATQGDHRAPATWMALAAGWSGGSVVDPKFGIVPPPPYQTARAVRAGLMIAMAWIPNDQMVKLIGQCLENGIKIVEGVN